MNCIVKLSLILSACALVAGCSGSGALSLDLNSDDLATNQSALQSAQQGLDGSPDGGASGALSAVKSINVTITEIDVHSHADGEKVEHEQRGDAGELEVHDGDVADDAHGWEVVSKEERAFDLMTVRNDATRPLGDITLPSGDVDQIRLKLKQTDSSADGARIAGAVVDVDGTTCDLVVPQSAINPGIKIDGIHRAVRIANGGRAHAIISIRLSDSSRITASGCAFRLNPVLKVKRIENDDHHSGGGK